MNYLLSLFYVSFIFSTNIYSLDSSSSSLEWIGRKLTGSHNGSIQFSSGKVLFDGKKLLSGELKVAMGTIRNNDISREEYRESLENHLKSEDFFNVDSFPSAELMIIENLGFSNQVRESILLCDLTIKGITHQIKVPVKLNIYNSHATASGTIDVDRTLYNIKYKSKSFFPDIGDRLIYNDFTLNFSIRVNREW